MSPSSGCAAPAADGLGEDRFDRRRHRFELQRDVGDHADDGDQRHGRRDRLALAVARRDEVGDRGDVLALGEPHDADDERVAQADHQHRPDIDRQEIVVFSAGKLSPVLLPRPAGKTRACGMTQGCRSGIRSAHPPAKNAGRWGKPFLNLLTHFTANSLPERQCSQHSLLLLDQLLHALGCVGNHLG